MRLVTDIHLVPLLWRHLALLGELAAAVEGFLVDDVQDDLGIDIAAGGTGRGVGVGVVCRCLEIGDGIDGIAVENRIAALVEKPQAVEEFIYIARRLVDVHHDEFAFVRLLLQEIDYLLCVGGRQAGSGLVEKEDDRLADELEGDVQTLALTAGDGFLQRGAYFQVTRLQQVELAKHLCHTLLKLRSGHAVETQAGGEIEILVNRQFFYQKVVLRDETYKRLRRRLADAVAVDGDSAALRLQRAVEKGEKSGLARAGTAHNGKQLTAAEVEREVVHAVVAARETEIDVTTAEGDALVGRLVGVMTEGG